MPEDKKNIENQTTDARSDAEKNVSLALLAPIMVFSLAFLARLGYLIILKSSILFDTMVVDAAFYDSWGMRIAGGDWLGGSRAFYDPPLYAYFLGVVYKIIGHDYFLTRLIQITIGSAHCVIIYLLGSKILDRRAGMIAGVAAALYKPLIYFDAALLKSFLTSALVDTMLLVVILAIEKRSPLRWFIAGALLGLLTLLRVNMLAFAGLGCALFACGLVTGRWGDRMKIVSMAAAWAVGLILVLLPVAARNYKVSGQFIIVSSYLGQNFYTGNNPFNTSGNYQRIPFVRANPKYEEEDFKAEAIRRTGKLDMSPRDLSGYWMNESLKFIWGQPLAFFERLATRFRIFWNSYEVPDTDNIAFEARYFTHYLLLPFLGFGFIGPLGLIGAALMWRDRRRLWPLYVFTPVYLMTMIPFFVFARYRLPVTGSLLALSGAAALQAWALRPNLKKLTTVCVLFLALAGLINYPLPNHVPDSEGFLNLGTIWREKGDLARAEYLYNQSLALNPNSWEAAYFLATTLREDDKCELAVQYYAQAIRLLPGFADAVGGMGICLEKMGDDAKAREFYIKALENKPGLIDVRLKLIHMLIRRGNLDEARSQIATLQSIAPGNKEAIDLAKQYGL